MATVLVCVDSSSHSDSALDFYIRMVHKEGNRVLVVHCPEYWKGIGVMEGPTPAVLQRMQQETNAHTAALRDKSMATLSGKGITGEFVVLEGKEPWDMICKRATTEKANLIVIGTRGHGKLKRTLMGSCSSAVVHHAHCPVLVCRQ